MKNLIVHKPRVATALLLLCGIPLIASATMSPDTNKRTTTVSTADLNLLDEQGVTELYRRLQRASHNVCGATDFVTAGSLKQRQLNQQCYRETLKDAVQTFSNAKLTQLHADSKRQS
jgi:UrcA family protein